MDESLVDQGQRDSRIHEFRQYLSSLQGPEYFIMVLWIAASVILMYICFFFSIPIPSTYALHNPASGLILTALFLPVLLFVFKRREGNDDTRLNLSYKTMVFFVTIHILSINLYFLFFPNEAFSPVSFFVAFLLPLLILVFVYKVPLKKLGFTGGNSRNIIGSIVVSVVYGILVFVVIGFTNLIEATDFLTHFDFDLTESLSMLPQAVLYSIPVLTLVASIPEEFLYRAVIQTRLTERLGPMRGILLASLVFGMCHIPSNLLIFLMFGGSFEFALFQAIAISFLFQSQIGILFGIAWARTRSLILPICLHTVHNVVEMMPVFLYIMLGIFG
ncbi:MAG: lysostaphin resistance A-like protein [Candidatus Thorarchaeota archaeon]